MGELEQIWSQYLTGRSITSVNFGYSVGLESWDADNSVFHVLIESEFHLIQESVSHKVVPTSPETVAPVLSLVSTSIVRLSIGEDEENEGTLEIEFSDGRKIVVRPDPDYEAWKLSKRGSTEQVIASPGGELFWCK